MPNSLRSSHASETCRLEWRPSRLLGAALLLIGVLGALAALASGLPAGLRWLLAAAAVLHGVHATARERVRPLRHVLWDGHAGVVRVDGVVVSGAQLAWRGPLACVRWQRADGRRERLLFWPDVLSAQQRRELRLAAGNATVSPARASMAP